MNIIAILFILFLILFIFAIFIVAIFFIYKIFNYIKYHNINNNCISTIDPSNNCISSSDDVSKKDVYFQLNNCNNCIPFSTYNGMLKTNVSNINNKCISLKDNKGDDRYKVHTWDCNKNDNSIWNIEYINDKSNSYKIKNPHIDFCLYNNNGSLASKPCNELDINNKQGLWTNFNN